MKKLQVPIVAAAVLYLKDDQHSDSITGLIEGSDLTELGYKGKTPEKTVLSQLRNSNYSTYFKDGDDKSHFRLANPAHVLDQPEVRLALFALLKQSPSRDLWRDKTVEFTFIGSELSGVRNPRALLSDEAPRLQKIMIPDSISDEDIEALLPNKTARASDFR